MTPISRRGTPRGRDLTLSENKLLNSGRCPFCEHKKFYNYFKTRDSGTIECANNKCQAFFFLTGMSTAQLIYEPKNVPVEKIAPVETDTTLLDFLAPKKQSWFDKFRENVGL